MVRGAHPTCLFGLAWLFDEVYDVAARIVSDFKNCGWH
jgi:hypothetical protein